MGDRTRLRFRHRLRSLRESVPGKNPIELTPPQDGGFQVKISARNILKGKIVEVTKGQTTAHVRIDIGGAIVTASITNEAVDDLKLASGQSASAVIKASDVMVAID
jgi:molybdopterin-binding protein